MNITQRLMRSRNDKMIAGVAGGLGHYLDVDPVIVRLAFVLLAFSGFGLLIYPVLWLVMPLEPASAANTGQTTPLGNDPDAVFVAGGPTQRARFDPMTGQPLDPEQEIPINNIPSGKPDEGAQTRRNRTLGIILLALGGVLILNMLLPSGMTPYIFPVLLIGAGVLLLRRSR